MMAANEATSEAKQVAVEEALTDKLEELNSPMISESETQDAPEYRADVGSGRWMAPPSAWKSTDEIYLRLKDGNVAGPFTIVACHAPQDRNDKWRYDVKDKYGKIRYKVSASIIV